MLGSYFVFAVVVVFVVVGCNFSGWLWLCFDFHFSFLPAVGAMVVLMTCSGSGCGGLWLLQWWLWQVE